MNSIDILNRLIDKYCYIYGVKTAMFLFWFCLILQVKINIYIHHRACAILTRFNLINSYFHKYILLLIKKLQGAGSPGHQAVSDSNRSRTKARRGTSLGGGVLSVFFKKNSTDRAIMERKRMSISSLYQMPASIEITNKLQFCNRGAM